LFGRRGGHGWEEPGGPLAADLGDGPESAVHPALGGGLVAAGERRLRTRVEAGDDPGLNAQGADRGGKLRAGTHQAAEPGHLGVDPVREVSHGGRDAEPDRGAIGGPPRLGRIVAVDRVAELLPSVDQRSQPFGGGCEAK